MEGGRERGRKRRKREKVQERPRGHKVQTLKSPALRRPLRSPELCPQAEHKDLASQKWLVMKDGSPSGQTAPLLTCI